VQVTGLTDEIQGRIAALPGVAGVEKQPDRLSLRLDEDLLALEDLLPAILATGARVRMFQPEALDIETAFMKLTRGKVA
jgi:ABC-2 type transport system ATP-binding protein